MSQITDFVIAPRVTCRSCGTVSGPTFTRSRFRNVKELLRQNVFPTGSDRVLSESNISFAESEIELLKGEVSRLERTLKTLRNHLYQLIELESNERALVAPVRKLPVELLQRIFRHVHDDSFVTTDFRLAFVRVASYVCIVWRSVACSFGYLWSEIAIPACYCLNENSQGRTSAVIEQFIVRSKEYPINIRIAELGNSDIADLMGTRCIQSIAENAYRWKEIEFYVLGLFQTTYNYIPRDTVHSHLTKLAFNVEDDKIQLDLSPTPRLREISTRNIVDTTSYFSFQSAPVLTKIDMYRVNISAEIFSGIQWENINSFTADAMNLSSERRAHDIIRRMPSLVHLYLNGMMVPRHSPGNPVVLSRLESLKIAFYTDSNFMDAFSAPSLKTLDLAKGAEIETACALRFLQRSGCSLKVLKICGRNINEQWNIEELARIEELHWRHPDVPNVMKLKSSAESGPFFPLLKVLKISYRATRYEPSGHISIAKECIKIYESGRQNTLGVIDLAFQHSALTGANAIDVVNKLKDTILSAPWRREVEFNIRRDDQDGEVLLSTKDYIYIRNLHAAKTWSLECRLHLQIQNTFILPL